MKRRTFLKASAAGAVAAAYGSSGTSRQESKSNRPNILLLFSDQHKADVIGCAGHGMVEECAVGHNVYEDTLRVPNIPLAGRVPEGPDVQRSDRTDRFVSDTAGSSRNQPPRKQIRSCRSFAGAGLERSKHAAEAICRLKKLVADDGNRRAIQTGKMDHASGKIRQMGLGREPSGNAVRSQE